MFDASRITTVALVGGGGVSCPRFGFETVPASTRSVSSKHPSRQTLCGRYGAPTWPFPFQFPTHAALQNLEITWKERLARKCVSYTIMMAILVVSLAVLVAAQQAKLAATSQMPDLSKCVSELPAIAYGTEDYPSNILVRTKSLDFVCGTGSFHLTFGAEHEGYE